MKLDELRTRLGPFCRAVYEDEGATLGEVWAMPGHAGFSYGFEVTSRGTRESWFLRLPPPNVNWKGTVLLAADGREGVDLFRSHADEIQAVVLDRTMPDISSEEAFDEMRRIRPDARIILISGRSEERATWHFLDKGLDAFIHKPFEPLELLDRVRRILQGA